MAKDVNNSFVIPRNVADSGKVFNGMFDVRNLVEAVLWCLIVGYPELKLITLGTGAKVAIMIFTILPIGMLALFGIGGYSLSQYAINVFNYMKKKRRLHLKKIGGAKKNVKEGTKNKKEKGRTSDNSGNAGRGSKKTKNNKGTAKGSSKEKKQKTNKKNSNHN